MSGKSRKEAKKLQKIEYLENEKSFLDEIKNTFHSFWRATFWWKNKNLIKNSGHKFYGSQSWDLSDHWLLTDRFFERWISATSSSLWLGVYTQIFVNDNNNNNKLPIYSFLFTKTTCSLCHLYRYLKQAPKTIFTSILSFARFKPIPCHLPSWFQCFRVFC